MEVIELYNDFERTTLPWATLLWVFFRRYLWCPKDVYLLAGDEVVVTKAGKKTYGVDRFFSSLYGKSVSGLSFFALSLISVKERHSFPIRIEQTILTDEEKKQVNSGKQKKKDSKNKQKLEGKGSQTEKNLEKANKQKNKGGRPKGSKNKNKTEVELNPELLRIKAWIESLLKQLGAMQESDVFTTGWSLWE